MPRCRLAICEKKEYEVRLELTEHLSESIKKERNLAYGQLKHLTNLLTEALTTSEGVGDLILSQSGEYVGITFESEVQSRKIYYQLKHVLTADRDFNEETSGFHFSEDMLYKRHAMVGMEKALQNDAEDDMEEEVRTEEDKRLLLRSMDKFIIKEDD